MTAYAIGGFIAGKRGHPSHHAAVASDAVTENNQAAELMDPDRLVEISERECGTVLPAVDPFYRIFLNNVLRSMAIVTGDIRLVRRSAPSIELPAHDVTVLASLWVIEEIRSPTRVKEGKYRYAEEYSEYTGNREHQFAARKHRRSLPANAPNKRLNGTFFHGNTFTPFIETFIKTGTHMDTGHILHCMVTEDIDTHWQARETTLFGL